MMKEIRMGIVQNLEAKSENNEMILEGYASTFNNPTVIMEYDGVEYKEQISDTAFNEADMNDVVLRYNHLESVPILARSRGGSLTVSTDSYGLKIRAKLFDTQSARDVYSLVKQGGLDKMSFAFTVRKDSYDSKTRTRTIEKIGKLIDVAVVDHPAYSSTSVSARSYFDEKIADEVKELELRTLEFEKEKLKLILEIDV